jgi:anti-sigma regulatory factor (Ser/Thr protein kinase)
MPVSEGRHDVPALHLELEPGPGAPAQARRAISGFAQNHGLDSDSRSTLLLLVSEIVTNAVIHPEVEARAGVSLQARIAGPVVRVEITDRGSGFTPQERDPAKTDGGYGLYLLDKAAAQWGINGGSGTTVWFEVPAHERS